MSDVATYLISLRGQVDAGEVNAPSPLHLTPESADAMATRFTVRTDQSGLIGLLRQLHARGFVLMLVRRAVES